MNKMRIQFLSVIAAGLAVFLAVSLVVTKAQQPAGAAVKVNSDAIGGVVTSSKGPEAGVWVIAETTDLGTRYIKSVVTDDRGRYVIPELPKANYEVWVRGYGLVDSPKLQALPGKALNLKAAAAPNEAAAAQYYPAIYWYSMLEIPPASRSFMRPGPGRRSACPGARRRAAPGCHSYKT